MINRRVRPYIIGVCIVAVITMFYVGIKAYQRHVEPKGAISDVQAINRELSDRHVHHEHNHTEVDNHHVHSADIHTHEREISSSGLIEHNAHSHTDYPKGKEDLELAEWVQTGKLTPFVEQELKRREEFRRNHNVGRFLQQIVTPDGQLGQVVVYEYNMYKEGDAIFESELVTPDSRPDLFPTQPLRGRALILPEIYDPEGVHHYLPDEYYDITDPYEREEYFNKFEYSIVLGISMDEVEAKITAGELDVSLSDLDKQLVDENLSREAAIEERNRLRDMGWPKPTPLGKPPVKVRFKPEIDTADGLSGFKHRAIEVASDDSSSTRDVGYEQPQSKRQVGRYEDQSFPRRSGAAEDVPPTPDNLTSETIKAQLKELEDQLPPEQFSNVQQLMEEFGAEEGLRQFRDMPPEHKGARNSQEKP